MILTYVLGQLLQEIGGEVEVGQGVTALDLVRKVLDAILGCVKEHQLSQVPYVL